MGQIDNNLYINSKDNWQQNLWDGTDQADPDLGKYYKAINWDSIEDMVDKLTWEKLTEQFWLDTRIPVSNDLDDWRRLSAAEQDVVDKVFGGLTLLDTLQSEEGP